MRSLERSRTDWRRLITWLVVLALVPLAGLSLYRGMANALGYTDSGRSIDFHSYWNPARQLLEGRDPYQAVLSGELTFDDGAAGSTETGLANNPANSPLMLLILSPLAVASWPVARLIWALVNLGLVLALPVVAMRLLSKRPAWSSYAAIALVFYAMLPTRNVISNGQTSLLVVFLTLLAVLATHKNQWLAGLLLGIALSKYSLTLPVVLWFLIFGYGTTVILAFGVQAAGVLVLSLAARTSPWQLLTEYYQIAFPHTSILGDLDLPSLLTRMGMLPAVGAAAITIGLVLTLVVLRRRYRSLRSNPGSSAQVLLFALLLILPLPFIYHRVYDAIVLIMLPIALLSVESEFRNLPQLHSWIIRGLVVGILLVFVLPRFIVVPIWPAWDEIYPFLATAATVSAWGISLWLVWQMGPLRSAVAAS